MYRIIGLQNPEEKYIDTPHNIGGQILELIWNLHSDQFSNFYFSKSRNADISENIWNNSEIELILPKTYMNLSGNSLPKKIIKKDIEKIIVIVDDIDLPFGKIKITFGRGDGGHNGIKSIISKVKTKNFIKIKIGVCPVDFFGKCRKPSKEYLNKYLTEKTLPLKYLKQYPEISKKIYFIINEIIENDYKTAMNKFN